MISLVFLFSLACSADLNSDNQVNVTDLGILNNNYGKTQNAKPAEGDIDGDGDIDITDLGILFEQYGTVCNASEPEEDDSALTELERRWLARYVDVPKLQTPTAHWSLGRLSAQHPRLYAEICRISGLASLGHWDRSASSIAAAVTTGLPIAVHWSPNEANGPSGPSGLNSCRTHFANVAAAAQGRVIWVLFDSEWAGGAGGLSGAELSAYHEGYVNVARESFGVNVNISFYSHGLVWPSAGAEGWTLSRTTAGTEPGPITVSLYRPYDFGWTQQTLERSLERAARLQLPAESPPTVPVLTDPVEPAYSDNLLVAALQRSLYRYNQLLVTKERTTYELEQSIWEKNERIKAIEPPPWELLPECVVWFPMGGAYTSREADIFGPFEWNPPELTDAVYYQMGARANHPWMRHQTRRVRFGPWGKVGLVVFYPSIDDPRIGERGWYAFLAYCAGARLDQDYFATMP